MEWVETTARTVEEAKELALDQLGVVADEAEFEVLGSPSPGLFGRVRGEARVRARVRPAPVRPKQERRAAGSRPPASPPRRRPRPRSGPPTSRGTRRRAAPRSSVGRRRAAALEAAPRPPATATTPVDEPSSTEGAAMTTDERADAEPSEANVAAARSRNAFVGGLSDAFGFDATVDAVVDGSEIEVRVDGASLGLLIGPGGRTLLGVQDLARVAAQRRLGDHDAPARRRGRIPGEAGVAFERFADDRGRAGQGVGVARSLDPMPSADRKVLHDALAAIDGVTSRSEGEEPYRRVVVAPA